MKPYDVETVTEAIQNHYNFKEGEEPISFFIEGLDEKEYALYRGEPNVIMARSGVGKTTMLLNVIAKNIMNTKNKFLIISQEMNKTALIRRLLAIIDDSYESKWREYKIKDRMEFDIRKQEALKVSQELDDRLFITEGSYTLSKLLEVLDYALLNDFDGVFIDYFQLIEHDLKGNIFSEAQQLKEISQKVTQKIKNSKLMVCWLSQVIENEKSPLNDRIKGTSQVKNDVAGILNVFIDPDMDNTLILNVQKDRSNGNFGLQTEVAFNKGKQRIGEFKKGRLQNQAISHERFVKGVRQKPLQFSEQPKPDFYDEELPF